MKITLEIPDIQIRELDELSAQMDCSRTAIIREAINEYIGEHKKHSNENALSKAFGLWRGSPLDGLAHQDKLRQQW